MAQPIPPTLTRNKKDEYSIVIGATRVAGGYKPQGFHLGTHRKIAIQKAAKLLEIWERQGGLWTAGGLAEARVMLKTLDEGRGTQRHLRG